ncbi:MAG: hypothetical protein FD143_1925 [Ignavibacteria bacterium]|nr:MAG: hypothetical protein FD143_1925 [Ignavibacteria bacterium]KAF0159920.1 MAG: hypothetical protein FD188_2045 [Ignavibacteria bacterium]
MIIKYTNFSDGLHEFKLSESSKKLGLEDLFFGDIEVDCKMDKSPHQIVLDCSLTASTKYDCDRCAKETIKMVSNNFLLSFMFTKEKQESDNFNFKMLSPEEDKIDLSADAYEYAELALPMKKLCNEECKGLCPKCGRNLNEKFCNCDLTIENDIWAPLKSLKDKFNN